MSEKRPCYWDMPAELRPPNWRRLQAESYAEEERVALERGALPAGELFDDSKADVVPSLPVLRARISQPKDEARH